MLSHRNIFRLSMYFKVLVLQCTYFFILLSGSLIYAGRAIGKWYRRLSSTYFSEHGVPDGAEVDGTFICQVIENIEGSGGFGTLLLVAKYQVDPLMQLAGHKLALQGLETEKRQSSVNVNRRIRPKPRRTLTKPSPSHHWAAVIANSPPRWTPQRGQKLFLWQEKKS